MARDTDAPEQQSDEPKAQDVTAGKGRRDEVGKTGIYPSTGPFPEGDAPILTPADINQPHPRGGGQQIDRNEKPTQDE